MSVLSFPGAAPGVGARPGGESAEEEVLGDERRRAVRLLLARPLVTDETADPEAFALVRRHEAWLRRWFGELLGYRLVVDTELARLHKRPAPGARLRPLHTLSGNPFDPRRYALVCLVLAALERMEVQTVLSELAEGVQVLAASEEGVRAFDLESFSERQAFVDAVRWLVSLCILTLADGDDTAFVEGRGDALYDIHSRRLGQLLASSVPPSLAAEPEDLSREAYPETDEGANRRSRHRLMRRLVEEPVLYLDELEPAEAAYLASQRHYLVRQTEEATGLRVEVRREGLAAVDPPGRLTDLAFPAPGTVAHAALLLAEELAGRIRKSRPEEDADEPSGVRSEVVPHGEVEAFVEGLLPRHGSWWSKRFADEPGGAARLAGEAVERLEAMGLVLSRPEGVVPRPALARYSVQERARGLSEEHDGGGPGVESGQGDLGDEP